MPHVMPSQKVVRNLGGKHLNSFKVLKVLIFLSPTAGVTTGNREKNWVISNVQTINIQQCLTVSRSEGFNLFMDTVGVKFNFRWSLSFDQKGYKLSPTFFLSQITKAKGFGIAIWCEESKLYISHLIIALLHISFCLSQLHSVLSVRSVWAFCPSDAQLAYQIITTYYTTILPTTRQHNTNQRLNSRNTFQPGSLIRIRCTAN